jgi:hypothetical protein
MILTLLFTIILELGVIIYYVRRQHQLSKAAFDSTKFIDYFYPVFSKNFISEVKLSLTIAERNLESARNACEQEGWTKEGGGQHLTDNIRRLCEQFVDAEFTYDTEKERLYRLVEGNIAVLNGKTISEVLNEYNKWTSDRMWEHIGVKIKKMEEYLEKWEKKIETKTTSQD